MNVYTIGFTKTTAARFFERLQDARVEKVIDVRLNNRSQLAGFAKRDDLQFFLRALAGIEYVHEPMLAPTQDILDAFKKEKGPWDGYERAFLGLMRERCIEEKFDSDLFNNGCLLCSEAKPHHCHRRLVVEYLAEAWPEADIRVVHL